MIADPTDFRGPRRVMIIGEAPGQSEDLDGRPFVGKAGILLRQQCQRIGLKKRDVYITNCVMCHPPGNRDPLPDELKCCKRFLAEKISICNPSLLVLVGKVASSWLLARDPFPITKLCSQQYECVFDERTLSAFVVLHPSYALRGHIDEFETCMDKLGLWLREKGVIK